ncbi:GIY-YIG nuclease family protein [Agromyces bracchium]|uniref:Bacteriophage T5 Orf172 DNA-binding domain-containing protein n=1 Tax=Agromyces bracchium TaxID=88376 RepID=A0A6I3M9G2_9MICO|nr:GIY-YIG nuclease family protein [Agromyces bracchium]MTH70099.1 hypothetical protein [Agromyces bracchium]
MSDVFGEAVHEEPPVPARSPQQEIEDLILANEGRLGDVHRLSQEGLSPEEIAQRLDVATVGFVYTYRTYAAAALTGRVPGGTHLRRGTISALNSLVKRGRDELSPGAMQLLQANRAAVERAARDEEISPAEAAADVEEKKQAMLTLAELRGVSGIYAFSYGWYLESPVDPARGTTLIKVGRADDVALRIQQHTSGARAHMPEPLALLRVYAQEPGSLTETERLFHDLLEAAGHGNPRRRGLNRSEVGREWFLTSEDYLDTVARALKLRTLYLGWSEFGGD